MQSASKTAVSNLGAKILIAVGVGAAIVALCFSPYAKTFLHGPSIVQTYHLHNSTACRADVQDSTLVLRTDGTYSQSLRLMNGKDETVEREHWTYDSAAKRITFSKFLLSSENSFPVNPVNPVLIVVNRDAGCYYTGPK